MASNKLDRLKSTSGNRPKIKELPKLSQFLNGHAGDLHGMDMALDEWRKSLITETALLISEAITIPPVTGGGSSQTTTTVTDSKKSTAPDAAYVVMELHDGLSKERVLVGTAGQIEVDDGGPQQEVQLSLTVPLTMSIGGTGAILTPVAGAVVWTDANSMELTAAGSTGQLLVSQGTGSPIWQNPLTAVAAPGADTQVIFNDGGVFGADAGLRYFKNSPELRLDNAQLNLIGPVNRTAILITGYEASGSSAVSGIDLSGSWITSGQPTALKVNIADGGSHANSALLALQISGVSKATVRKSGALELAVPLAAIYGGTGQSSYAIGDLLYANTTTTLAKLADVATGNVLLSGGVNTAPAWGKVPIGGLAQVGQYSVLGNPSGSTADVQEIGPASNFQILRRSGVTLGFGAIDISNGAAVGGALRTVNGGTGLNTYTQGDLLYASTTGLGATLSLLAKDTNATRYLSNQGGGVNNPSWNQINLANGVTGDLAYANLTPSGAASKLLGRRSGSAGDWEEITLGGGLSMSGTTISSSGGGGTPGGSDSMVQFNDGGAFGGRAEFIWNNSAQLLSVDGYINVSADIDCGGAGSFGGAVSCTGLDVDSFNLNEAAGVLKLTGGPLHLDAGGDVAAADQTVFFWGTDPGASFVSLPLELRFNPSAPAHFYFWDGVSTYMWFRAGRHYGDDFLHIDGNDGMHVETGLVQFKTGSTLYAEFDSPNTRFRIYQPVLVDKYIDIPSTSTPANPASGTRRIFTDTGTGKLSVRTNAGTTVSLEEGAAHALLDGSSNSDTLAGSVAQGDLLFGNATPKWARLAKDTTASQSRYLSNTGTSNAPAWAQVNLANGVSGDLPFANLTQIAGLSVLGVTGNSTADVAAITAGTDNQILRRNGTALTFGALNLASSDAITGDLPFANLTQGSGLSVLGVTGNSTADVASIAAGTDNQVLRRSGTALAFGAVNLASSDAVTGDLLYANLTPSVAASKLLGRGSASGAGDWQEISLGAGLSMSGTTLSVSPSFKRASAKLTALQGISNSTQTDVSFDAEEFDTDSIWTAGSPTRFTCQTTGIYIFTATIRWGATPTWYWNAYFHVRDSSETGLIALGLFETDGAGKQTAADICAIYELNAGERVYLCVKQDSGVSRDLNYGSLGTRMAIMGAN